VAESVIPNKYRHPGTTGVRSGITYLCMVFFRIIVKQKHISMPISPKFPNQSMFSCSTCYLESRGSVVGIATGCGLYEWGVGVQVPERSRIFSSPCRQTGSGVHPTSYPMSTGGSFPGVKRPWREADHSPPTSVEVKKMWIYTSTTPYVFMA
jgi:hypothetical protein